MSVFLAGSAAMAVPAAEPPRFESDILPILTAHCLGCHSGPKAQAGLDLRTIETLLKGGKTGPAVLPGIVGQESADGEDHLALHATRRTQTQ